jgi:hypothetical protein
MGAWKRDSRRNVLMVDIDALVPFGGILFRKLNPAVL